MSDGADVGLLAKWLVRTLEPSALHDLVRRAVQDWQEMDPSRSVYEKRMAVALEGVLSAAREYADAADDHTIRTSMQLYCCKDCGMLWDYAQRPRLKCPVCGSNETRPGEPRDWRLYILAMGRVRGNGNR